MFVKNPVQKGVVLGGVLGEFGIRVENAGILVVTVQFDQVTLRMGKRLGSLDRVYGVNDCRFRPALAKGVLQQTVEVGRQDYANEASVHEIGDGAVRLGRNLAPFLQVLIRGFDVPVEDRTTLIGGCPEFRDQVRVAGFFAVLLRVPRQPIVLLGLALGKRKATDQVERDFPAGGDSRGARQPGPDQNRVDARIPVDREGEPRQDVGWTRGEGRRVLLGHRSFGWIGLIRLWQARISAW